jgi:hypothetical protein
VNKVAKQLDHFVWGSFTSTLFINKVPEEWRLLGCYAVWFLITDVSEERSASIIRVTRISEFTDSWHPDDGDAKFLRNVRSYKSQTA